MKPGMFQNSDFIVFTTFGPVWINNFIKCLYHKLNHIIYNCLCTSYLYDNRLNKVELFSYRLYISSFHKLS
jgi:hypothetical protein